jgi:SAM-dependent methyltransferase
MINSAPSQKETYRLKYTGTLDQQAFEKACAEHNFWYHSFYFDNGFQQQGDYDIGLDIEQYNFPQDMSGMSVLDVGTGSGWFATYFEQLGADVTTLDARGLSDFDIFGRYQYPDIKEEKAKPDKILSNGQEIYYSPVSKGFWIMKEILGLKAEYVNAKIYDVCPELFGGKTFDLVFLGSLLMHIRDPIGALMAVRSVCKDRIIANTLILDAAAKEIEGIPLMTMLANDRDHLINWWQPTKACVIKWFKAAGFSQVNVDHTVNLTTDKIYVDDRGKFSGCNQTLYLVDADISNQKQQDDSLLQIQQQPLTTKAKLVETQYQLGTTQQQLSQTQEQLTATQQQLETTKAKLVLTQQQLETTQQQKQATQQQKEHLKYLIVAMESSKFWKLRKWWFELKQKLNISGEDIFYQNYLASIKENSTSEK